MLEMDNVRDWRVSVALKCSQSCVFTPQAQEAAGLIAAYINEIMVNEHLQSNYAAMS